MDSEAYQRVSDPASPARCQGVTPKGQCQMVRMPQSQFCRAHVGCIANKGAAMRNYRVGKWQQRMEELADNNQVKSLREEIGVCRMMLEEIVNRCGDGQELVMFSNKIADLVMKIEKLVVSCHKLEERTGMLLDRTSALYLATRIVDLVGREVTDEEALNRIASGIVDAIVTSKMVQEGK